MDVRNNVKFRVQYFLWKKIKNIYNCKSEEKYKNYGKILIKLLVYVVNIILFIKPIEVE